MADQDFVISSKRKIREGAVGNNKPNSEAVNTQLAGSINALIDTSFFTISYQHNGYFADGILFEGAPTRINAQSEIYFYSYGLGDSGSSGSNALNVAIYDSLGAFVGNVFGTGANQLLMGGNNVNLPCISYDLETGTPTLTNTSGLASVQAPLPVITTLQPGYILVPFVESASNNSRSFNLTLRIREL